MSEETAILNAKEELALANKLLGRIAAICTGALDPELTREQVIGRVKVIYSLAAFDDEPEDPEEFSRDGTCGNVVIPEVAEGP